MKGVFCESGVRGQGKAHPKPNGANRVGANRGRIHDILPLPLPITQIKGHGNSPNDVIEFEITFGAVGMCIVTSHAGRGHGEVRIDGLEIMFVSQLGLADIRANGMDAYSFKAHPFEFIGRTLDLSDRKRKR